MTAGFTGAKMRSRFWTAFSFSLLLLISASFARGISAGTEITPEAEVYVSGYLIKLFTPSVMVGQIYGLEQTAGETSASLKAGSTFYSPHTITNVGNGSDLIHFSLSDTSERFTSTLVLDDKNTPVPPDLPLAEDACYSFFVALTSPLDAGEGLKGTTALLTRSSGNDGGPYIGANGALYGGVDSIPSRVELNVSEPFDRTPPTISDFLINEKRRFAGDIISPTLKVEAIIRDNITDNIGRILFFAELYQGDKFETVIQAEGLPYYDAGTCQFRYVSPTPLNPGTYRIRLEAWDKAQNSATEAIYPLTVNPSDKVETVGPVLNHPNPFAPLKGEISCISYYLSTDATITLYLFDIRGTTVWRRTYAQGFEGGMAGYNEVPFDGFSDFGGALGNGVYIYKIVHKDKVIGKGKLTVLD